MTTSQRFTNADDVQAFLDAQRFDIVDDALHEGACRLALAQIEPIKPINAGDQSLYWNRALRGTYIAALGALARAQLMRMQGNQSQHERRIVLAEFVAYARRMREASHRLRADAFMLAFVDPVIKEVSQLFELAQRAGHGLPRQAAGGVAA